MQIRALSSLRGESFPGAGEEFIAHVPANRAVSCLAFSKFVFLSANRLA